eukprot:543817-Prorocentrum_lima.AAC.1
MSLLSVASVRGAKRRRSRRSSEPPTASCGDGDALAMNKGRKIEQALSDKQKAFTYNRLCGMCGKIDNSPDPISSQFSRL